MRPVLLAAVFGIILSSVVWGDVKVEPRFGHPYIFSDRIVFTSVDGTHLIGLDKRGQLQWEVAFSTRIFLQRSEDRLFVQAGRSVYSLNVANGTKSQLFLMPQHEVLIAEKKDDFLAAADTRFDRNHLRILRPVDLSTAWESSSIESIVDVTPSTVVAITADRKYDRKGKGYSLGNGNLRGFDRKDGKIRWSMPFSVTSTGPSAAVDGYVAVIDQFRTFDPTVGDTRLLILNPETGAVLSSRTGIFTDLWPIEGALGVLERASFGSDDAEFYVCTLPGCPKVKPTVLSSKEILRVRLYGNFIITSGIYDSACFERSTGTRLWEKGQLEWSEPFGDEMVVTEFSLKDLTARMVAIDLQNGQERLLFKRKVTPQDKLNFRPW